MNVRRRKPLSWLALALHLLTLVLILPMVAALPEPLPVWVPYLLLAILVMTTGFAVVLLEHRRTSFHRIVIAMAGQALVLIMFFALIFQAMGLIGASGAMKPHMEAALYFSIVTWTTLGYGDFQPVPPLRLFAAMEAIVGYVYLGLIVGLATSLFRPADRSGER